MLDKKTFIGIVAVMLCAQSALGAASVRSIGGSTSATGGTTARAGSLRTGTSRTSTVTPKTSVSTGTGTSAAGGRVASVVGGPASLVIKPNKLVTSTAAAGATLAELERRVEELSLSKLDETEFEALQNTLTTELDSKISRGTDFEDEFDARFSLQEIPSVDDVSALKTTVQGHTTSIEGHTTKISGLERSGTQFESDIASLKSRATNVEGGLTTAQADIQDLKDNPGTDATTVKNMIDTAVTEKKLTNETYVANTLSEAKGYADTKAGAAETNAKNYAANLVENIEIPETDLTNYYNKTQVDNKLSSKADSSTLSNYLTTSAASSTYAPKSTTYTKDEVDTALSSKANSSALSNYLTTSAASNTYALKSSVGDKPCGDVIKVTQSTTDTSCKHHEVWSQKLASGSCVDDAQKIAYDVCPGTSGRDACSPKITTSEKDANNCITITIKPQKLSSGQCVDDNSVTAPEPVTLCDGEDGAGGVGGGGCVPSFGSVNTTTGCYSMQKKKLNTAGDACENDGSVEYICPACSNIEETTPTDRSGNAWTGASGKAPCYVKEIWKAKWNSAHTQCVKATTNADETYKTCNAEACDVDVFVNSTTGCKETWKQVWNETTGQCVHVSSGTTPDLEECPTCPDNLVVSTVTQGTKNCQQTSIYKATWNKQTKKCQNAATATETRDPICPGDPGDPGATVCQDKMVAVPADTDGSEWQREGVKAPCYKIVSQRMTYNTTSRECEVAEGLGTVGELSSGKTDNLICDGTEIDNNTLASKLTTLGYATQAYAQSVANQAAATAAMCDGTIISDQKDIEGQTYVRICCDACDED